MERNCSLYQNYIKMLNRELVPAMGCTEPIAVAFCAAKARAVLGILPSEVREIEISASGNIIKNVKSVVIPNTGRCVGTAAAAAVGVLAGQADKGLEVISEVPPDIKEQLREYMLTAKITTIPADSDYSLDIAVTVRSGGSWARVRTVNEHVNIVSIEKNGQILERRNISTKDDPNAPDYNLLTMEGIWDFAQTAELDDVRQVLERQIELNTVISQEGLRHDYGANIGKVLLKSFGSGISNRAKAAAAAASDARMNGCSLAVVINAGSGNQGITASLPVIEYAKEMRVSHDKLLRALLISNLITLHTKTNIGRLSAYCGAVNAGASAGAGIAYICGGDYETIIHTVVNALAVTSGIICDGAKASCAAKIAAAVDAGILGWQMFLHGQQFYGGDGIILKGIESTIRNIGRLGRIGMKETDKEIIRMMTE